MPTSIAKAIVFDMRLLESGSWKAEEKSLIENWIKEDGFEEKRAAASNLISILIPSLLGEDCSENGRVRSKRLGEMLQHFEDLLATTKGGMAKKFYRDHLNHMLRVTLFARAVSNKNKSLPLSKDELRILTLACLVHDIAYPLAESSRILDDTVNAMKKCYGALSFPHFLLSYDMEKVTRLLETIKLADTSVAFYGPLLKENNHGLMGAIEFIDYINQEHLIKYRQLLQAIVFHDASLRIPDSLQKDNVLKILILSDEFQDWGRPVGIDKEPAISDISNLSITSRKLQGSFEWRAEVSVSPLRQIYSKIMNLRRVEWPNSLNVSLTFILPKYETFNLSNFEKIVQKIIDYCERKRTDCINELNVSWNRQKELFKSFYGKVLPETDDLVKFLIDTKKSPKKLKSLYFSPKCKEILHIDKDLGKLSSLKLELKSGKISSILHGEKEKHQGLLYCQNEKITEQPVKQFVARLILFHGLAARVASKRMDELPAQYIFPSTELIKKALRIFGLKDEMTPLTENLRDIRRCIIDDGFFTFQ